MGLASCNPIHFQRIQFTARKQRDVAFKHEHKIHQQKITEYISNKDAASTEQMLEDTEHSENKAMVPRPMQII